MTEGWLWSKVKRGLEPLLVHCARLEETASFGIPDVNCCCHGKEFWLELKIVREKRIQLRSSQVAWITSRCGYGGRVFLLAKDDDRLLVISGTEVFNLALENGYVGKITPLAVFNKPWNWPEILHLLLTHEFKVNLCDLASDTY